MLKPGDTFERYTIEALVGQGGMGCVYRAHDEKLGRRVALKVISGDDASDDAKARLVREARAAAALDHPNAVAIFDVGEHDGEPYIVMELVEGQTLRSLVGDSTAPAPAKLARLADVARALDSAHRRGLVHRDVKPENVMVRDDGMVKVLDFGIARRAHSRVDPHASTVTPAVPTLTIDGAKFGTPVYMAPEQIRGDALDGRADQFAWGVLAYEVLTGRLPWRGADDALAVTASILTDDADRAPLERAASRGVADVVLRALSKRPEDRFASMDEVVQALDAAERGEAPAASVTAAQQFSTGEIRDVLAKAVEQQAAKQGTKLRFDELLAVAAEVGVDEESLREATRALRKESESDRPPAIEIGKRDTWLRQQRRTFHRHAGVYVIVNLALLVLGLVLLSFTPWWIWFIPALGWGVGLAIHGLVALSMNEDDYREHEQGMEWWRDRQRRRHELEMARASGAKGGRRARIAEDQQKREGREAPRLRVADTGRERAAEAEAADEIEDREARRARR